MMACGEPNSIHPNRAVSCSSCETSTTFCPLCRFSKYTVNPASPTPTAATMITNNVTIRKARSIFLVISYLQLKKQTDIQSKQKTQIKQEPKSLLLKIQRKQSYKIYSLCLNLI